jgi:RHS repeat-associated protein
LLSENISGDPTTANNGALSYVLDPAGNRVSLTSTLAVLPDQSFSYDPDDRLLTDTYDANGNTLTSGGNTFAYDFEDRLTQSDTSVQMAYDGDGNRIVRTQGGSTTRYLVDNLTPTGYAQVAEEVVGGAVVAQYTYGSSRISQNRGGILSYYGYDGGSSVRELFSDTGAVTDNYAYDAFGNTVVQTGSTVNEFLYRGEQSDSALGMYDLRARYYDPRKGRFLTADKSDAEASAPCDCGIRQTVVLEPTHNLFEYADADPVDRQDPSGFDDIFAYEASSTPGVQSHHIIEQRLQPYLIETESKLVCILEAAVALAIPDHQQITSAFRAAFPYKKPGAPPNCYTEAQVMAAIYVVYKNNPAIIQFMNKR